jgi:hypothetical protein
MMLTCTNDACRHRWRNLTGQKRRQAVAEMLEMHPDDLHPEDVDLFGNECPKCGSMGVAMKDRRVWR